MCTFLSQPEKLEKTRPIWLNPVNMMSGFSIGAGLAAVDIDASCERTFGCCRVHLVAPTRFKEANIFQINSFEKKKFCPVLFTFFSSSNRMFTKADKAEETKTGFCQLKVRAYSNKLNIWGSFEIETLDISLCRITLKISLYWQIKFTPICLKLQFDKARVKRDGEKQDIFKLRIDLAF